MNNVELLSPAGDLNSFYAAINNGADAIYLGLGEFNARAKAENFNAENIQNVVHFAHLFNVKVYVTLNTIIKNEEITRFVDVVNSCVNARVDAFIVQDFGVVNILNLYFKNLVLHASTQMGIHNLKGALVAQSLGFKRVILSRESTLKDIKEIKEKTNLEIEFFVHGALCVSFSGNCYMSSVISGLSGNRGQCQQYCRKKYMALNDNGNIRQNYHFSTKDLCLINELKELVEAGVCSFKIEGRLRRPGYVAVVTNIYRSIIDNNFFVDEKKINVLKTSFSRGDFNYHSYLHNEQDGIINENNQNHIGVKIGELRSFRPFKNNLYELEIYANKKIMSGDGLKFLDGQKEIFSLGVGNVIDKGNNIYKIFTKNHPLKAKLDIYLTLDKLNEDTYLSKKRKIDVNLKVIAKINKPLCIIASSNDVSIRVFTNTLLEEAQKSGTLKDELIKQVSKTGGTEFNICNVEIVLENVFIPKSIINKLRRDALDQLKEKIVQENEKNLQGQKVECLKNFSSIQLSSLGDIIAIDEESDLSTLDDNFSGTIACYFKNYKISINGFFKQLKGKYKKAHFAINLPIIMPYDNQVLLDKIIAHLDEDIYLIVNNIYGLSYLKNRKVIAGFGLNINNDYAINLMKKIGVSEIFLSHEVNKNTADKHKDCYIYTLGYQTLMNFFHCPYMHIYHNNCGNCTFDNKLKYRDEFQKTYSIRRNKMQLCTFELINYRPVNLYLKAHNQNFFDLRCFNNESEIIKTIQNKQELNVANEYKGSFFKGVL